MQPHLEKTLYLSEIDSAVYKVDKYTVIKYSISNRAISINE